MKNLCPYAALSVFAFVALSAPWPAWAEVKLEAQVRQSSFGKTSKGREATLFTCVNANGLVLKLTDFGATVVAIETPDRSGKQANVTLGYGDVAGYENGTAHFGCTVGRFANRINRGSFKLDGKSYQLARNKNGHHLHGGGDRSFDRVFWKATLVQTKKEVGVSFAYRSPHEEEGYPGNLDATVTYVLTRKNEVVVIYEAKTDRPTVVNLTNHCYWNLAGNGRGAILEHVLKLASDKYLAVDADSIPTGKLLPVAGTPMDFNRPTAIGARLKQVKKGPEVPYGYGHCYVVRPAKNDKPTLAARLTDPASGRSMAIFTTQPALQFYCGYGLDGSEGQAGQGPYSALCLEAEHFPDSPNHPSFPTTTLRPGDAYKYTTIHRFSVVK
jgi:aldose 1-epimerase